MPPRGRSVVIDPDGRIVVAGTRDGKLLVIRLNVDGTLDMRFGTAGALRRTDGRE